MQEELWPADDDELWRIILEEKNFDCRKEVFHPKIIQLTQNSHGPPINRNSMS